MVDAITGSRRMGSEKTVSNYINGIAQFINIWAFLPRYKKQRILGFDVLV